MWTRKKLKTNAKAVLKRNYWGIVIACLLIAIALGSAVNPAENVQSLMEVGEAFGELPEETEDGTGEKPETEVELADNAKGGEMSNTDIVDEFLGGAGMESEGAKRWTRGILSQFADNAEGAGNVIYGIMNTINQMVFKERISPGIIIGIGVMIGFLLLFFVQNVLQVGFCRYLLETRTYSGTHINRLLFGWHIKRVIKIAKILFVKWLYLLLWSFTIVGGIIKRYSYMMVPYIAAENPEIGAREAILLSRQMMKGNKWKAFVLDLSFLPWVILDGITFGLLNILFVTPYQSLTGAELYMELRGAAKEASLTGADKLCDTLLDAKVQECEYPVESYLIPPAPTRRWAHADYNRRYSISSLILIFFSFSFVGWLWEVSLHLFKDGVFVNRGVLLGPWLPIYGTGGVLVVVLLKKLRSKPALTFLATMVVSGIVEYSTSWFLETTKGLRWWDYSGYFLNLNGRICLEGLLVFAMGGCAAIYLVAPALDDLFKKIPVKMKNVLCGVLVALFCGDQVFSHFHPNTGKGITDYKAYKQTAGMILYRIRQMPQRFWKS